MYLNFYNLRKAPFHITPDPEFLFLSSSHKEALGAIIYCIAQRKGFASIIGEVGTGKTTLARSYLARSNREVLRPIYVFNPAVTFSELLRTIFQELGVTPKSVNLYDMVQQLQTVLIREYELGHNIVLIIDEAQNMPIPTFERLRILSNIETSKDKLLQIILVGQPELKEKLADNSLRQLNQRMAIRATLRPLTSGESRDYILFRLAKAAQSPQEIFSEGALRRIIKAAKGAPRMLNILCDNSLVAGFGYQKKKISGAIAKQVIADFEGKRSLLTLSWKYASIFGACLLFVTALNGISLFPPFPGSVSGNFWQSAPDSSPARYAPKSPPEKPLIASFPQQAEPTRNGLLAGGPLGKSRDDGIAGTASQDEDKIVHQEILSMPSVPVAKPEALTPSPSSQKGIKKGSTIRIVRPGDYLTQICLDRYGYVNSQVIKIVTKNNPSIVDADLIFTGDKILLPELTKIDTMAADYPGR